MRQELRLRPEIRLRVWVRGMRPHIRPLLHNPPRPHDDDTVGQLRGERDIVGDEEEGYPSARTQAAQIIGSHLPDGRIQPLRRLVRENPLRLACVRHRTEHALQHSARELMRIGTQHPLRIVKAEPRKERRILRLVPCGASRSAPHIRHLPPDAVHRAQCSPRQLRYDAPLFAPVTAAQLLLSERGHVRSAEQHLSLDCGSRRQCAEKRLSERRFPAAALSNDRRHAPRGEHSIHMIERGYAARAVRIAHSESVHGKRMLLPPHPRTS